MADENTNTTTTDATTSADSSASQNTSTDTSSTTTDNENTDYTSYDYITSKQEDYLSMSSNELLHKARNQYDDAYDSAIYNAHKFLQSACTHCASILDKTTDTIRAKGELLKNGINIFAHTPEPNPEAIGNTALVVPKLTAEADMQNRYETPMGYSEGSSSGNSGDSGGGGSVTGYHGLATNGTGMDVLAPHPNIPGEGVDRWRPYVCDAIVANGLTVDDNRLSRIMMQIQTESSGNPEAVQGSDVQDVNSASGDLAKGLMQTISATFNANSFSGHTDIFNGYDNLLAAIHYIIETYGPDFPSIGEGHGY